jgi:type I restriction enzyme S subunit
MAGEWITTSLRDEADLLTGFPFKSDGYTESPDGVRLLRGDNIVQASLRWDGVKRWPQETARDYAAYELAAGDVVLAMDRPWIEAGLKYAAISYADLPCLLVQRTTRLRGKERLHTAFLRYLIGSMPFTQHVLAVQTGTTVPHISGRQILDYKFQLPPLPEQKRIAHILGTLDDKIELNRRMNATLEGISRTLFKSWFVDFDPVRQKAAGQQPVGMDAETAALFPDSFEDSEIGEVPSGWQPKSIYTAAEVVYGAPFASRLFNDAREGLPLIRIRDLPAENPDIHTTERHPKGYLVQPGDVLVGMDGEFRAYVWGGSPGWLNQRVCAFRPQPGYSAAFVREAIVGPLRRVEETETATTVIHLGKADIDRFRVIGCPVPVAKAYGSCSQPLYDQIVANKTKSRTLAALRDTLLPKLLSGEIRVPKAEEAVEEAVG